MEKETRELFISELKTLLKKYEIKNAAFTGNTDKIYIGMSCLDDKPSIASISESVHNIGRLWQSSRGIIRDMLNDFEKAI